MAGLIVLIFIMVRNLDLDAKTMEIIYLDTPEEILKMGILSFFLTCVILFSCLALPRLAYLNS